MVPAEFVALDQPPAPAPRAAAGEILTPVQAGLSHLWSRLLRRDRVGLDDDFFALGGNSLLAAEMLAHARVMFGIGADWVRPLTRGLLRDPSLRGFARAAERARAGRPAPGGQRRTARRAGPTSPRRRKSAMGMRGTHPVRYKKDGARRRTRSGPATCCSPGRPVFSARTCLPTCSPPPPRGSGAWSGRALPGRPGSASPRPPR
jgi:hypothetical protein